ncbi:MAG: hypothetical protein R3D25_15680 [Geminicoccaceae bacterium]
MRDILQPLPRRQGRDLEFGEGSGPFSGWSQSHRQLDLRIARRRATERLGRPIRKGDVPDRQLDHLPDWRLHDLRRTVVTGIYDLGVLPHVVETVINHVSGEVRRGVAGVIRPFQPGPLPGTSCVLMNVHPWLQSESYWCGNHSVSPPRRTDDPRSNDSWRSPSEFALEIPGHAFS